MTATDSDRGSRLLPLDIGADCACGALAESGKAVCRKCHARSRWERRRSKRRADASGDR
jgi:hypothetical protein